MLLFGIFGNPVTHSISPRLHNAVLNAFDIEGCYGRFLISNPSFLLPTFRELGFSGVNVTVPHKELAFEVCDEVRGIAQKIGAVNTLVKEGDNVIGYNTDAEGFFQSIASFGKLDSALIIGAGGTAKAIAMLLKERGMDISILNRSRERLFFFESHDLTCNTWETFEDRAYDLIINTTSAGLEEELFPCPEALLDKILSQASYAVDVIYNKQTPFLQKAALYGLTCKDGKEMLLYQAVLAFNLFFQNKYDPKSIESIMREIFKL